MNENESIATYIIREQKTNQKRMFTFLIIYFLISSAIIIWSIIDSIQIRNELNEYIKNGEICVNVKD